MFGLFSVLMNLRTEYSVKIGPDSKQALSFVLYRLFTLCDINTVFGLSERRGEESRGEWGGDLILPCLNGFKGEGKGFEGFQTPFFLIPPI